MGFRGIRNLVFLAAVLILALSAALLAGCGDGTSSTTTSVASVSTTAGALSAKPKKIAIVIPEKSNDFGWNQQGVESAKAIAKELGAQVEVVEEAGYGDISPVYRRLVAGGADWIILWAGGYTTVGKQLAQETKTKTLVVSGFDQGLAPGLVTDFETNAEEGAYLAGVAAAKMSKSGKLGIVASADDANWNKMAGGFIVGAKAARSDITIQYVQVGQAAYADAVEAKRVTETAIAAGSDVIFGMGDGSSLGMIQAVESAKSPAGSDKVWFIDVIGDKTSIDTKGVLLSSVVWDYLPLLRSAVDDMTKGAYGNAVTYLDLKNGGIKLLQTDKIPAEVWTAVQTAREGIMSGSIKVPVTQTKSDIEALLK